MFWYSVGGSESSNLRLSKRLGWVWNGFTSLEDIADLVLGLTHLAGATHPSTTQIVSAVTYHFTSKQRQVYRETWDLTTPPEYFGPQDQEHGGWILSSWEVLAVQRKNVLWARR